MQQSHITRRSVQSIPKAAQQSNYPTANLHNVDSMSQASRIQNHMDANFLQQIINNPASFLKDIKNVQSYRVLQNKNSLTKSHDFTNSGYKQYGSTRQNNNYQKATTNRLFSNSQIQSPWKKGNDRLPQFDNKQIKNQSQTNWTRNNAKGNYLGLTPGHEDFYSLSQKQKRDGMQTNLANVRSSYNASTQYGKPPSMLSNNTNTNKRLMGKANKQNVMIGQQSMGMPYNNYEGQKYQNQIDFYNSSSGQQQRGGGPYEQQLYKDYEQSPSHNQYENMDIGQHELMSGDYTGYNVNNDYNDNDVPLTIDDFNSNNLRLQKVPKVASQTCKGQLLLKPVVKPVPYTGLQNKLMQETIEEFNINKRELMPSNGTNLHRFNHITQNIKMASKINQQKEVVQSFKKSVLNRTNPQNLHLIKLQQQDMDIGERLWKLSKFGKWERFKHHRAEVVNRYIQARRKQLFLELFLKQLFMRQMMTILQKSYEDIMHLHQIRLKGRFMSLVISQSWRRRNKRWGGSKHVIYQNILRRHFSQGANQTYGVLRNRSLQIMVPFMLENIGKERMRIVIRDFYYQIMFIQKRVKDQFEAKSAKVEVLLTYWDKLFGQLQLRASKQNDSVINEMCKKLIVVPKHVAQACLEEYVNKCRELYAIAFLQWRLMYPKKLTYNRDDIKELLETRIKNLNNSFKPNQQVTEETQQLGEVPSDFNQRYNVSNKKKKVFLVNSFYKIGMADPFPNEPNRIIWGNSDLYEDERLPEDFDSWAYSNTRYMRHLSPYCIYIPSKEVMLKLMRSCLGVKDPQDLWFNRPETAI